MTPAVPPVAARGERAAPGLAAAAAVACAAVLAAPALAHMTSGRLALPAMVVALVLGVAFNRAARAPALQPGLDFAVKTLLRWAIALLGLRIALGDIVSLGAGAALGVVAAMAATIAVGMALARAVGADAGLGALAGAANAVCGASATLAVSTVVPAYPDKRADVAFTVVMANAVSTIAMLAYPPMCALLDLSARQCGVMLGATIQDMAQVAGAGYAASAATGDAAVVVKLFRVFLLLPVVLALGAWFARRAQAGDGAPAERARAPMPLFAVVFVALAIVNTIAPGSPFAAIYQPAKAALGELSQWGLLIAIAALGLGTSPGALASVGWRHLAVFCGAALAILALGLMVAMLA